MNKKYIQMITSATILLAATQVSADATTQQLTSHIETSNADKISVSAFLNSNQQASNGLGIAIAFDSSKISFEKFSYTFPAGLMSTSSVAEVDSADIDNNPQTDRLVRIAWVDIMGQWEGIDYEEAHLLKVDFDVVSEEPVEMTTVTFSSLSNSGSDTFESIQQAIQIK